MSQEANLHDPGNSPAPGGEARSFEADTHRALKALATDPIGALASLKALSDAGYALATCNIGIGYAAGAFGPPDATMAEEWYRRAVGQGSLTALFRLGLLYRKRGEYLKALEALESSATAGYPPAMRALAGAYYAGDGTPSDLLRAKYWWERAVRGGNVRAKGQYGIALMSGKFGAKHIFRGLGLLISAIWEALHAAVTAREEKDLHKLRFQ
jgi:TPR repeat protein